MDHLTAVEWIEIVGWLASLLTVATYSMNTMIALRILAIGSSLSFLVYGLALQLWPLVVMELILLPINAYRFWQVLTLRGRLLRATQDTGGGFSVIMTYGKRRSIGAGTSIFKRGDPVDRLYFLAKGRVMIEELAIEVVEGDVFGEIAFFTDAAERTASARAINNVEVYEIDRKRFMRLQFEDPSFGLSIMRTITRRLTANSKLEAVSNETAQ